MQNHSANQLYIEMPHSKHSFAGFAYHGESFRQQRIKSCSIGDTLFKFISFCVKLSVSKRCISGFQRVDCCYGLEILFDQPVITASEDFLEQIVQHEISKKFYLNRHPKNKGGGFWPHPAA